MLGRSAGVLARLGSDVCGEQGRGSRPRRGVAVPFRAAFGRARIEALAGTALGRDAEARGDDLPGFEYALLKRDKKRSADEELWNALGLEGWELVGVTGKHAAFKRRA